MRQPRLCALCNTKVRRDRERLCPEHINEYRDQLQYDKEINIYRVGPLTEPWLSGIIELAEEQHNVDLRDYGRTIPIEKIHKI